jgi:glycosyltransferase involved in cell wall biosynthesis
MRIGMILDKTFPPDPRVENEALALIKSGHRVFLFCLIYEKKFQAELIQGIEVKRYPSNTLEYKLSALSYSIPLYRNMMSRKIAHFLKENKVQVIHVHDMVIADAVVKANKDFGLPWILDLHENRPEIMKTYPHLNKFPGNLLISPASWKHKEGVLVQQANRVIVVTREAKEELKKRTGIKDEKIAVVPNTVSASFYTKFTTDTSVIERYKDKFVILYLGDTGLRRGLMSVIEAFSIIGDDRSLRKKFKLVIVGQNSSDTVLKKKVHELGLDDLVDFEGWQDMAVFPSYLQIAKIGISPLHRNLHHDTTYANKLFQYMSFAVPLLVSDALSQKNLVEEVNSGLVHKEKDAADIAEKILYLYHHPGLALEFGSRGKQFIEEKFCWEKVSNHLKDLYLKLEKP